MEEKTDPTIEATLSPPEDLEVAEIYGINGAGHVQELDRNFNLLSACGMALTAGNTWAALGGSIVVAISNGGPPGVLYEFVAASFFYWFIAASIAELASAVPSAGGVYHWASLTAGRHGRVCGFFAGWWNLFAWILGMASIAQISAAMTTSMYALFHPGFVTQKWHVFLTYEIFLALGVASVLWGNRYMPALQQMGGFLIIAGCAVTVVVCAAMANPHASDPFVWKDWQNATGYSSDGFVFCMGMLNGAFTVGTPDVITHLAEEIPRPSTNLPKTILIQYIIGFTTAFIYAIALFYGLTDLDAVLASTDTYLFPLTEIYRQATTSSGGAFGLLMVVFFPSVVSVVGGFITSSRTFWTLARDNAAPFSETFSKVHPRNRNPSNAIIICYAVTAALGCIYLGSAVAFSAFVGSFVLLSTLSYLTAILPHLLSRRRNVRPGRFWMGWWGYGVNAVACSYIVAFDVIFLFPFTKPTGPAEMNYTCVITGAITVWIVGLWYWKRGTYRGPPDLPVEISAKDAY